MKKVMKHEIDPEAIRRLGYKVADIYADVVGKANALPESDREALYRIAQNIFTPFVEGVEELSQLGETVLVETCDD